MSKFYVGNWCSWCCTWVDGKDVTGVDYHPDLKVHRQCGYDVSKRRSDKPIQPSPPTQEVLKEQKEHRKMMSDFLKAAR